MRKKKIAESIPTADFDSEGSMEEKKDLGTRLEKKMHHLRFLEHPLQTTHGAFLTFTAHYKQLPGYSLP